MIAGVVQVRMDSTRLPRKALADLAGEPMLFRIVERLRLASRLGAVIVATSDEPDDEPIREFCARLDIPCHAGSKLDLASRLLGAAEQAGADAIVIITGDCPLVDPGLVDEMVERFEDAGAAIGCLTNMVRYTYPDGLDTTVLSRAVLERAGREIADPFWREWVVGYLLEHADEFAVVNHEQARDESDHRWTVDYAADLEFVGAVYERLYPAGPAFGRADVMDLIERDPAVAGLEVRRGINEGFTDARAQAGK